MRGSAWRLSGAVVLLVLLGSAILSGRAQLALAIGYAVMGALSLLAYGADKRFAERRQWRISETTLLGLDLCLGIIGGLLGQAMFRHKTQKQGYVVRTILILVTHIAGLSALASGLVYA